MKAILASMRANLIPMQLRGHQPKGMWQRVERFAFSSGVNLKKGGSDGGRTREEEDSTFLGQISQVLFKFGSWWMRWIGNCTVTPLGIVTPLISMVFSARPEVLQRTQHSFVALGLSLVSRLCYSRAMFPP